METRFVPIDKENKENGGDHSSVDKAKESAEIQKYETERIEQKRLAVLAENDIKDTEDLRVKIAEQAEKEAKLKQEMAEFENKKAIELSEIAKQKSELAQQKAELDKRIRDAEIREQQVALREKLVQDREEIYDDIDRKNAKKQEEYNSLKEQLKRGFPELIKLIAHNANELIACGFGNLGNGLWDDIEQMQEWEKDNLAEHTDTVVEWLKQEVVDCNDKAVFMSRNPRNYRREHWDKIVDNLEKMYELLPVLKPNHLPNDEEEMPSNA